MTEQIKNIIKDIEKLSILDKFILNRNIINLIANEVHEKTKMLNNYSSDIKGFNNNEPQGIWLDESLSWYISSKDWDNYEQNIDIIYLLLDKDLLAKISRLEEIKTKLTNLNFAVDYNLRKEYDDMINIPDKYSESYKEKFKNTNKNLLNSLELEIEKNNLSNEIREDLTDFRNKNPILKDFKEKYINSLYVNHWTSNE